jgi:hypothetical protein
MSRLLLVLLLAFSFRPMLAGSDAHAHVRGSALEAGIGIPESSDPAGALRPPGGWEILPPLETGRPERERDGGSRSLTGPAGQGGAAAALALPPPAIRRVEDALRGAGVLRLRYEHLPYFATAPPSAR